MLHCNMAPELLFVGHVGYAHRVACLSAVGHVGHVGHVPTRACVGHVGYAQRGHMRVFSCNPSARGLGAEHAPWVTWVIWTPVLNRSRCYNACIYNYF